MDFIVNELFQRDARKNIFDESYDIHDGDFQINAVSKVGFGRLVLKAEAV